MPDPEPEYGQLDTVRLIAIIETNSAMIRFGHDINAIMALVTDRATDIVPAATGAAIEMIEGDEMVYRAVSGLASDSLGLRLTRDNSLSGLCVAGAETLYCEDAGADPRVDHEAVCKVGVGSMIVTPLNSSGKVFGALKVISIQPHAFSTADIRIIELLSGSVAVAIENAIKYAGNNLLRQATTDYLTGLANRAVLSQRLRASIADAMKTRDRLYLLVIDMDGLKELNDQYGHRVGDAAITETARRITAEMRQTDTVARLGGDEFAVLIYPAAGEENLQAIVRRLCERCNRPLEFEGERYELGASVGIAIYPDACQSSESLDRQAELLLDAADLAMYREKRARCKNS